MSQFPTALPDFTDLDPDATLAANNHAARHNKVHDEVAAMAGRIGITNSSDPESHEYRINELEDDVAANSIDIGALQTEKADADDVTAAIAAAVAATKEALYPIGTIYENYLDNTNPATLLGFGTWVAVSDRFLIGKGSGTFATAGDTGGEENHTLTVDEMPTHRHDIRGDTRGDTIGIRFGGDGGTGTNMTPSSNGANVSTYTGRLYAWDTGGGAAHNNLPPYRVIYIWRRTA